MSERKKSDFQALASLLEVMSPSTLNDLRMRFPEQRSLFEPSYVLGGENAENITPAPEALAAFSRAGAEGAERALKGIIVMLGKRIRRARFVKLCGSIVTSVSSAGVVSALMLTQPQTAIAVALVGFTGSVASIVGEHMSQPLAGNQKSLGELLADAISAEAKLRDLHVIILSGTTLPHDEAYAIASKVNSVATTIREIMIYGNFPVADIENIS